MTADLYVQAKRDYDNAAAGVRSDLEAAGETEWRLREIRVNKENKPLILPILTRWLLIVRYWPVADDLLSPYAAKINEFEVMPTLIDWMRDRPTGYQLAVTADKTLDGDQLMLASIGESISRLASPRWAEDILELVRNRSLGNARLALILRLAKTKSAEVPHVLMNLVDDDTVAPVVIKTLASLRYRPALPLVEAKVDAADAETRSEARKAFRLLSCP